jgi:hypothetical protein
VKTMAARGKSEGLHFTACSCFHQHSTHADDVNVRELRATRARCAASGGCKMERGIVWSKKKMKKKRKFF